MIFKLDKGLEYVKKIKLLDFQIQNFLYNVDEYNRTFVINRNIPADAAGEEIIQLTPSNYDMDGLRDELLAKLTSAFGGGVLNPVINFREINNTPMGFDFTFDIPIQFTLSSVVLPGYSSVGFFQLVGFNPTVNSNYSSTLTSSRFSDLVHPKMVVIEIPELGLDTQYGRQPGSYLRPVKILNPFTYIINYTATYDKFQNCWNDIPLLNNITIRL